MMYGMIYAICHVPYMCQCKQNYVMVVKQTSKKNQRSSNGLSASMHSVSVLMSIQRPLRPLINYQLINQSVAMINWKEKVWACRLRYMKRARKDLWVGYQSVDAVAPEAGAVAQSWPIPKLMGQFPSYPALFLAYLKTNGSIPIIFNLILGPSRI